ncbi:hypothetical protein [Janibacter sp. G1551]|uniref:hypothetical protein n=1 Tax=Janibacter sp. G1551 TaxID=3420440 RepID=UPI003D0479BE
MTTETTPTDEQVETPEVVTDDDKPSSGREAAKYRRALREAEAERDAIREQVSALRRQMIEDASGLTKPAALWAAGIEADALFTEAGTLDRDALREAVETAADAFGLTRAPSTPKPDLSQGSRGQTPQVDRWEDAFAPPR